MWVTAAHRQRVGMNTDTGGTRPRGGRAREWFARYAPAEVGAIVGAVLGAAMADPFGIAVATAYAGSIGEGIGFYAVLLARDLRRLPVRRGRPVAHTVRGLMFEFGPAELVDSLLVRPVAMYLGARLVGNTLGGVVVGKLAADAVFYTLAIIAYETRKWHAGRRRVQARGAAVVPALAASVPPGEAAKDRAEPPTVPMTTVTR
jgi:hypothetical protein